MKKLTTEQKLKVKKFIKNLKEDNTSYAQKFRDWCIDKGLKVDLKKDKITVFKGDEIIFQRNSNSFFRSAHLDSFSNQISKILGIENDFYKKSTPPQEDIKNYNISLTLSSKEYHELMGAIWDANHKAFGSSKKSVLKSLIAKFEKYYK